MAKRDKHDKVETQGLGWIFYIICFLLLTGPSIFLVWVNTYDVNKGAFPVIGGLVLAGMGAGVITWAVNGVWFAIASRLYQAKQKKSKSTKKTKKA